MVRIRPSVGLRRFLRMVAPRWAGLVVLMVAFTFGALAGGADSSKHRFTGSAFLKGGLIKSAQAADDVAPKAKRGAQTASLSWRVISVVGEAQYRVGSRVWDRWTSATPGLLLGAGAQVKTGETGEAVVSNGHDTLTVTSNSVLELPANRSDSGLTRVIQKSGLINYDIESRILPSTSDKDRSLKRVLFSTQRLHGRFEVVTPFLIVGVKGTNFDVDVTGNGASVDVSNGVVDVETPDGDNGVNLVAGQMASISTASGNEITIFTTTTASAAPTITPTTANAAPAGTSGGGKGPTGPASVSVATSGSSTGGSTDGSSGSDGTSGSTDGSSDSDGSSGGSTDGSSGGDLSTSGSTDGSSDSGGNTGGSSEGDQGDDGGNGAGNGGSKGGSNGNGGGNGGPKGGSNDSGDGDSQGDNQQ